MRLSKALIFGALVLALSTPSTAGASDCEDNKKHLKKKFTATISAGVIKWQAAPPKMKKVFALLAQKVKKVHWKKFAHKKSLSAMLQSVKCPKGTKAEWSRDSNGRFPAKKPKVTQEVDIYITIPNPLGGGDYTFKIW